MFQKFLSPNIFCYIIGSLWEINRYGFSLYLEHIYIYIYLNCCAYRWLRTKTLLFVADIFLIFLFPCDIVVICLCPTSQVMMVSYFSVFRFAGSLELLLCLKSKKQKVSDSLPSLMGSYHKSYLHAYLCQNFWVNG